ncbi:MAG: RluA family pseudouridine synthase, partial [Suilimivivens sp.]
MYQFEINSNEEGQRFDKYLHKLLPLAPASFYYKMLRKKNIVLNGKKAEGKEKLAKGDKVSLFLSEETFRGFQGEKKKDSEYL